MEPPLIVTEYYPRGSLFELLRKVTCIDKATHIAAPEYHAFHSAVPRLPVFYYRTL